MSYIVSNINSVSDHINDEGILLDLKPWFVKKLKKEIINRLDWLVEEARVIPSNKTDSNNIEMDQVVHRFVVSSVSFRDEFGLVKDWLDVLRHTDENLFAKLDRISWKQAVEHSRRWHEALARKAEKLELEAIPFDENCPVVLECDDGLKWVWLKTDKARDDEGRIMGHCVGNGGYDRHDVVNGVFSLRDKNGKPHVTMEFKNNEIVQTKMKGNVGVNDYYLKYMVNLQEILKTKNLLGKKFDEIISDGLHVYKYSQYYLLNQIIHRDNGPAIIRADGVSVWCVHGKIHREDGPAVIKSDGSEEWYQNNLRHRDKGPAVEKVNGDREWWVDGKRHRENGPSIEKVNGDREWYRHGKKHRDDGPAVERCDGSQEWWDDGDMISKKTSSGDMFKFHNNVRHSLSGPAVIYADGREEFWLNGQMVDEAVIKKVKVSD